MQLESSMQWRIHNALNAAGMKHRKEACLSCGDERITADFVVGDWAIECKRSAQQDGLLKGLGQCIAYLGLNMAKRAVIVIPRLEYANSTLWMAIRRAGVHIICEPDVVPLLRGELTPPECSNPIEEGDLMEAWGAYARRCIRSKQAVEDEASQPQATSHLNSVSS